MLRASNRSLLHAQRRVACMGAGGIRCISATTSNNSTKELLQSVSLERLSHQSRVHLLVADSTRATIRISPTLQQSEFALKVFGNSANAVVTDEIFAVHEETAEDAINVLRLSKQLVADAPLHEIDVELHVPHLVHLDIMAVNGTVTLADKFEGDVRVSLSDGNIRINKVRGEHIELKTNRGLIHVDSLIEGAKVKLVASGVDVKRLMAGATEIKLSKGTENSHLGAIYSSLCLVNSVSSGTLTVGNIHGFLRINGENTKEIKVNSVNGALHVEDSGASCHVDAHFDAWSGGEANNKIFVGGNVSVSLDPSAAIDVELHGNKITTNKCNFGESELDQLDDDYAIFTGSLQATTTTPTGNTATASSGKINVGSAKDDALRTSFFAVDNKEEEDEEDDAREPRPARLVVHTSRGNVNLEQLDWMGKIKRNHLAQ